MRIRCTNPGTKKISIPWIDEKPVVFSKNGFATVSDKMGHHLIRTCPAIEEIKLEKKKARTTAKGRGKKALKEGE